MSCKVSGSNIIALSVCASTEWTHPMKSCNKCSCCCCCKSCCTCFLCCCCCCLLPLCSIAALTFSRSSLLRLLLTEVWTSSVRSATCLSCTALVAARHVRRRPRAVGRCGPLCYTDPPGFSPPRHVSVRHVISVTLEFVSTSFPSTHSSCIVISPPP